MGEPAPHDHTDTRFDAELARLAESITRMGALALAQLDDAIQAVMSRDSTAAEAIVRRDPAIDALDDEVALAALRLLALRQPMARDLREILAALRISAAIERIGDYAANVAKRALVLNRSAPVQLAGSLPPLAAFAADLVRQALAAFRDQDAGQALAVWRRDEELDQRYTRLFRELLTWMMEDPRTITACTHLLFMAKNIERIGDHATAIAGQVHFLVRGIPIAEPRPKDDGLGFGVAAAAGGLAIGEPPAGGT
jgi:phosphate transport system protein